MRDRRPRRWEAREENDPLAGLVNLFDLWMVFSIAILIVFAGSSRRNASPHSDPSLAGDPQAVNLPQAQSIKQYRVSQEKLEGAGEKLGTAYRLASGEIVCVPDSDSTHDRQTPSITGEKPKP
ncbi:DUF2149 domain-containing protein [Singulisphaera acidiphila]|uniref:DUF2149 domain-containing protein n=1 Tax=Singulisphaera acidiphila (strain ATCC BAA-1392 / DSM 18658 / VKM B-2454 / MOB10) TaxID=886293 RepID=L0DDP0_SINAD|nr:DUF2149 domain-containing protein [Singulisphaera acidiphila]AGA27357.1 hypothetical protein Sinac_3076 [Singulisphaera acidiphila DSM 18658]